MKRRRCWLFASLLAVSLAEVTKDTIGYQPVAGNSRNSFLHVDYLILTCDSPGAYYQGSSSYRNSAVCQAQDKATIQIQFSIKTAVSSLTISVESGLYDRYVTVLQSLALCDYSESGSDSCPNEGEYKALLYYTIPSVYKDSAILYTPDLRLTINDDLVYTTGIRAQHDLNGLRVLAGRLALGFGMLVILVLVSWTAWCHSKHRQKRITQRKVEYFSTLPNGQVINMKDPPRPASPISNSNRESSALPQYNEPQVPTRPIL